MNDPNRLITLAIHTYERATELKQLLSEAGVEAVMHNVNLEEPYPSSGVRVRIHERDLAIALKVVEDCTLIQRTKPNGSAPLVLVPVDFSDFALGICRIALEWAASNGARVVLLHIFMNDRRRFLLPFASDRFEMIEPSDIDFEKGAKVAMSEFTALLRSKMHTGELPRVKLESRLMEGVPEECINRYAARHKPDLIVMGSHGAGRDVRAQVGSVTAEVLDSVRFPVLAMPHNSALHSLKKVKKALFFSTLNQQDVISLELFTRVMGEANVELTIVPVVEKEAKKLANSSIEQFVDYCTTHYPYMSFTTHTLPKTRFVERLEEFVAEKEIDLLVVPNRHKNIFSRLFNPGIAHRMIFKSDMPMLVVPC